jgi:protein-tyrosine phosphatase
MTLSFVVKTRRVRSGLMFGIENRGLPDQRGIVGGSPISPFVLHALREMAVAPRSADRFPQRCTANDLVGADFVVAVKEAEHRPLMRERFAEWEHIPDYWHVDDVEDAPPAEAIKLLAQQVTTLLQQFRAATV